MPYIQINQSTCFYELTGQGQTLVFIHGAFADARLWDAQMAFFPSQYQLLRYDLRGHGRSLPTAQPNYTMDTFVADLDALLDALDIQEPVLCGLSMGGLIAQAFAARYPEKPKALVLVSPSVSASLTWTEKLMRYILFPKWLMRLTIRILGVKRFISFSFKLANLIWGKHWLSQDEALQSHTQQCMLGMDEKEFIKLWEAFYSADQNPLERITCPTLVVSGVQETKNIRRHAQEILRRVPHARHVFITSASHGPNVENPTHFNQGITDFLNELHGKTGRQNQRPSITD